MRKKAKERFGETRKCKGQNESDTGVEVVEGVVQKWLVFFEKNLNRIANLDQKTCKEKSVKGKFGKDSITSYYTKSTNTNLIKSGNPSLATAAGLDLTFVAAKTVK